MIVQSAMSGVRAVSLRRRATEIPPLMACDDARMKFWRSDTVILDRFADEAGLTLSVAPKVTGPRKPGVSKNACWSPILVTKPALLLKLYSTGWRSSTALVAALIR